MTTCFQRLTESLCFDGNHPPDLSVGGFDTLTIQEEGATFVTPSPCSIVDCYSVWAICRIRNVW
jgi:hypothetical protein